MALTESPLLRFITLTPCAARPCRETESASMRMVVPKLETIMLVESGTDDPHAGQFAAFSVGLHSQRLRPPRPWACTARGMCAFRNHAR